MLSINAAGARSAPAAAQRWCIRAAFAGWRIQLMPRVSPDSRHLAFTSDASGDNEVYVRRFPGAGARPQVSAGGGNEPVWAPDGRGIFYRANGRIVLATLSANAPLRVLDRKALFVDTCLASTLHQQFDVMPDGRRLRVIEPTTPGDEQGQAVYVVQGWLRELRQQLASASNQAAR